MQHVDLPDEFNYKVYMLSAFDAISNTPRIDEMIKHSLLEYDPERLSIIHYLREGYMDGSLNYSIAQNFNELLYRTFQKNTTLATEEELYLDYVSKKRAGSNVIGSYDDLMFTILQQVDVSYFGNVDLEWNGRAFFNNDVWFTRSVYFGTPFLQDSNFKVIIDGKAEFLQDAHFQDIYAKSLFIDCCGDTLPIEVTDLLEHRSNLLNFARGLATPGAIFGEEINVIDKPTYFLGGVYFGCNVGGTACTRDGSNTGGSGGGGGGGGGDGGLINLQDNVTFASNVIIEGSLDVWSNIFCSNIFVDSNIMCSGSLSCASNITCSEIYADAIYFKCDSNYLLDNARIQNAIALTEECLQITDGLRLPGAYFTNDCHVITKPIVFASEVVFAGGLISMCGSNSSNIWNESTHYGHDHSMVTYDCSNVSFSNIECDVHFGKNVDISGDLILHGDLILSCAFDSMSPEYISLIRQAQSNSDIAFRFDTCMAVPGAIFDKDINVITKPTYFTDVVVFGNNIRQDHCCDKFTTDVIFDSNLYVYGEIYAKKVNADAVSVDAIFFDLSQNVVFGSNVVVQESLDVLQSIYVGSNVNVNGVLTVDHLVINDLIQMPVKPISPSVMEDLVVQIFSTFDDNGDLIYTGREICNFEQGVIVPGGLFGENGCIFTKPVIFNNDVYFGGDIVRQDLTTFSSNVEILGLLQLNSNCEIFGCLEVHGCAMIHERLDAESVFVHSDERIKKNIRDVEMFEINQFVKQTKVKEFRMKKNMALLKPEASNDSLEDGSPYSQRKCYGVIAQEIEKVNPYLVHTTNQFIPNVFKTCQVFQGKTVVVVNHGVIQGDRVKFVSTDGKQHEVLGEVSKVVSENSFELSSVYDFHKGVDYLLYGTHVCDFKSVDYTQITSICLRAIQDLMARVENLEHKARRV
jgi:hypothetical protein